MLNNFKITFFFTLHYNAFPLHFIYHFDSFFANDTSYNLSNLQYNFLQFLLN